MGNNPTVHYALDGQNVAQEGHLDQNGQFVADTTYLSGPRGTECRIDEATGQTRWYLYDGLGSVVGEVDENGNITTSRKYDVYGGVRGSTGTGGKQKFCGSLGHSTEPDTGGLIYIRARWYDPAIGRFISEDPAGDGVNWYAYCGNNPVNMVDATGESGSWVTDAFKEITNAVLRDKAASAASGVLLCLARYFNNKGNRSIIQGAAIMMQGQLIAAGGDSLGPLGAAFAEMVGGMVQEAGGRRIATGVQYKVTGWMCVFAATMMTALGGDAFDYWGDINRQISQ